jgi:hypothetical protein
MAVRTLERSLGHASILARCTDKTGPSGFATHTCSRKDRSSDRSLRDALRLGAQPVRIMRASRRRETRQVLVRTSQCR